MRLVHYTNPVYSFDYAEATLRNGDREFFV